MAPKKRETRKKQARLSFTPVPSSSPQRPEARVRVDDASTPVKRRKVVELNSDPAERPLSPDLAQAIALSKKDNLRGMENSPHKEISQLPTPAPSSQIEVPGKEAGPNLRSRRGVNAQMPAYGASTRSSNMLSSELSSADLEDEVLLPSCRRRRRAPVTVDSDSEGSEPITPSTKRMRRGNTPVSAGSSSETFPKGKSQRPPTGRIFLAGGTTGIAPLPRSQQRMSRFAQPTKAVHGEILSESDLEAISSSEKGLRTTRNRRRLTRRSANDDDEQEFNSEHLEPPRGKRSNHPRSKEQDDDDDSMLEELADAKNESETAGRHTRRRQVTSARSRRLEGLAKLKKRRAGVTVLSEDDGIEEDEGNIGIEEDVEENGTHDEDQESEEQPASKTLDDYESDFVENDGEIGIDLMRHGVPLKFTSHANKKPFDYFKDEIEWMVHNKLDPAFERYDEIYVMAHRKLDDEVRGLAGSEFKSSIWVSKFIKALESRPEFYTTYVGMDTIEPKCEACNRSKHPPKWVITFSGPTYDRNSLEKVSPKHQDDSNSSSEDDDDEEEDQKEERWNVGSVCCGNAEIAHTLYHWRFQLNSTVLQYLNIKGHISSAKILERENWSRKKREKLANKVVDGMVESGEMRSLYQQFKQNQDAARAAKAERVER